MNNETITVGPDELDTFWLHGNTTFETTETAAQIRMERDAGGECFEVNIDGQLMAAKDIKELRKFLKKVLADMKADPHDDIIR